MRLVAPPMVVCSVAFILSAEAQAACPGAYAGKQCGPSGGVEVCDVTPLPPPLLPNVVTCKLEIPGGATQSGTLFAMSPAVNEFRVWGEDDEGQMFCCEYEVAADEVVYYMYGTPQDDEMSMNDQAGGSLKYGHVVVYGYAGNDTIFGSHDATCADTLLGGDGADIIHGMAHNDRIEGESGSDILLGGSGTDTIYGGDGDDEINGGDDNDSILGGAGIDMIKGGGGHDFLSGGDDNDWICGYGGNDSLYGDGGDDQLYGGLGVDMHDGGTGVDNCENENFTSCSPVLVGPCPF